ncbi:23S rRNA (guanosine(2251)-2'-O)-methyltransferase RlmB [Helicobacter sp. 13S00482-2]|uniref:23S rRNA (guanosine(2251)-2'-O)-methyltransferase RlmB n=1 Tax=Helicobacter sp. 13S00482-2 TaxID=1476200 RepID=UPI000BA797FD|nr:23S rRNA (guanosine(2251)-2'-O)-methyltransferase RlmB [Helicobacter sp. 13S00482-2]PAF54203.1 23S rRNA (guanosine(2251)-2'-O)-methyltransferase RlmB [Helicobacter sp. 13S00482-2]
MIVYGKQVIMYLLEHHREKIQEIYLSKDIEPKLFSMIARNNQVILRLDNKKAQSLAKGGNHQGFLAKIIPPAQTPLKDIKKFDKLLVLCGITDVGNIGAIFRSAYCLGVDGIILGVSESISYEGVLRSSVGAMLDIPFCISKNILDIINELKNEDFFCYGADMRGENIQEVNVKSKWALFLGNEGDGLNRKILSKLDKIVSVKIKSGFNSLNVSVAAGILINRMS